MDEKAKQVITDENRKPWIQRQQNILMLFAFGFATLGALHGIISEQFIEIIASVLVVGVTMVSGVKAESVRDKSKFEAASYLLEQASEVKEIE